MTDLKFQQMNKVAGLRTHLAIIELVGRGYTEAEIQKYFHQVDKEAQSFLQAYLAL